MSANVVGCDDHNKWDMKRHMRIRVGDHNGDTCCCLCAFGRIAVELRFTKALIVRAERDVKSRYDRGNYGEL